jgi:hypothetical protein
MYFILIIIIRNEIFIGKFLTIIIESFFHIFIFKIIYNNFDKYYYLDIIITKFKNLK